MRIIASGTFDHLHAGHEVFLRAAFAQGYVLIGLSGDSLLAGKREHERIESYEQRKEALVSWLAKEGHRPGTDYEIRRIVTPLGFACEEREADAILVRSESEGVAHAINQERAYLGNAPLKIVYCDLLCDEEGKISSTRIRKSLSSKKAP